MFRMHSKLILVSWKSHRNKIYYIPFDAPCLALQHGIFNFSILNRSPYSTGSFVELVEAEENILRLNIVQLCKCETTIIKAAVSFLFLNGQKIHISKRGVI